jgi:hypothetical protein
MVGLLAGLVFSITEKWLSPTLSVSACFERYVVSKFFEREGEPEPDHCLLTKPNRNSFSSRVSSYYSEGMRPACLRYVAIFQ